MKRNPVETFVFIAILGLGLFIMSCGDTRKDKNQERGSYLHEIMREREMKDSLFRIPGQSPLPTLSAMDTFAGLRYFPPDSSYRVRAFFERIEDGQPFRMESTGEVQDIYLPYARVHFQIRGEDQVLTVFQNLRLLQQDAYQDYLFIPFRDSTSGRQSYGGGRYLDIRIPESDTIIIDFNKAYNPYCAYSYEYSCPVPPEENTLTVAIKAGEMAYPHYP
jgi:hypothetical protein